MLDPRHPILGAHSFAVTIKGVDVPIARGREVKFEVAVDAHGLQKSFKTGVLPKLIPPSDFRLTSKQDRRRVAVQVKRQRKLVLGRDRCGFNRDMKRGD